MVARVTLEIALRKEFDYSIPEEFSDRVAVGSRVKVPFGHRQVLGVVTELVESSPQTHLKPILNVLGAQTLVTPQVLELARWIASYYCCAVETALKSVLPEAVRKEEAGWRERLHVHALTVAGEMPKLTPRQETIWRIIDEWRELPLQELLRLGETTAETVRKLEDKGLVCIAPKIDERDPYARELIVPTTPLTLNDEQVVAFQALVKAHDGLLRGEPAKPFLLLVSRAQARPRSTCRPFNMRWCRDAERSCWCPKSHSPHRRWSASRPAFRRAPIGPSWPCCIRIFQPGNVMTSGTKSGRGALGLSSGPVRRCLLRCTRWG